MHLSLIAVLLAIITISSALDAYSKEFPQFIETGNSSHKTGFKSIIFNTKPKILKTTIPFRVKKTSNSYSSSLSIQDIFLYYSSSRGLSIVLYTEMPSNTSLIVCLSRWGSRQLSFFKIRYLIIQNDIAGTVNLVQTKQSFYPTQRISSSKSISLESSIWTVAYQTSVSLFLNGFIAYGNQINILPKYLLQSNKLTVIVQGGGSSYNLSYISFCYVLINKHIPINGTNGSFDIFASRANPRSTIIRVNTLFKHTTTFLGIRSFKFAKSSSRLTFQFTISSIAVNFYAYEEAYQLDIINFVYQVCNDSFPYYQPNIKLCYNACPAPYSSVTSNRYLCSQCSNNCMTCFNSSICTTCQSGFYLDSSYSCSACSSQCMQCSAPSVCSSCADGYYFYNSLCHECSITCSTCNDNNTCLTCADKYTWQVQNVTCKVDCSIQPFCNTCKMQNAEVFCTACSPRYTNVSGFCIPICGDKILVDDQPCDDGNLNNSDGCSSDCFVQDYFICNTVNDSTTGYNYSECFLQSLQIKYLYALKHESGNSLTVFITIIPFIQSMATFQWINILSFDQGIATSKFYIDKDGLLAVQAYYTSDLNGDITLNTNFSNVSNVTKHILPQSIIMSIVAENNLSLRSYSSETYALAAGVKYFCLALSWFSILLLLAGYFGGKLIVLEHLAVLQLIALCQLSVHDASSTFAGLRSLQLSLGITPLASYDYSSSVGREFKGSSYSSNLLSNLNFALLLVLVPPLAGLTCKILSLTLCKEKPLLTKLCPLLFGENTFFGLVACSYAILSLLIFNLLLLAKGYINDEPQYVGLITTTVLSLLVLAYCYLLNRFTYYFGDFKKKFEKYNICSYFYTLVILEKLLSSIVIIIFRNLSFGLIFEVIIICSQLAFVAIRHPYICGDNSRPLLNLSIAALCVFLIFLNNIMSSVSQLEVYVPIIICLLLALLLCCNLYYFIKELLRIREETKDSKQAQQKGKFFDETLGYEDPEDLEKKRRFQLQGFKRQLFEDHEYSIFIGKSQILQNMPKKKLTEQWDHYAILSCKRNAAQINVSLLQKVKGNNNQASDDDI